jgi:hypothetical protein
MKPIKLADVHKHTSQRAEQLNPWGPVPTRARPLTLVNGMRSL